MTANESLELLGTLERGPLRRIGGFSGRQVRYLATQGVLSASGRESAGQGDTRLYTADDVALQRLYVRLKAAGMPPVADSGGSSSTSARRSAWRSSGGRTGCWWSTGAGLVADGA